MAVFRVNKAQDYTVMSNFHLKDKSLSLKSKGCYHSFYLCRMIGIILAILMSNITIRAIKVSVTQNEQCSSMLPTVAEYKRLSADYNLFTYYLQIFQSFRTSA